MRPARDIMADLSATGMTPDQIALVMELTAAVSAEARPVVDEAANRRRARDKEYQAQKRLERRQISADSSDVGADPALSLPPNENNSNPPTHTHPDITTRAREDDFPRPEWCAPQVWRDLKANRKAKRLPCTPTAHAKLMRDIEKLVDDDWPPGRLIEAIVARGWAAAYDPRDERKPANDRTIQNRPSSTSNAAARARANLGC